MENLAGCSRHALQHSNKQKVFRCCKIAVDNMSFGGIGRSGAVILSANAVLALAFFFTVFRNKGLE